MKTEVCIQTFIIRGLGSEFFYAENNQQIFIAAKQAAKILNTNPLTV